MNAKKRIFTIILLFIFLISCSEKGKDPYPEFDIPVFMNSYEISTGFDNLIYGKSVNYFVQEKFPASKVQEFYESFLTKNGFTEFEEPTFTDKTWVRFNRESLNWDIVADTPPARRLRAWLDGPKNLIFKLTLYYSEKDKLSVTCFLHSYARHDQFNDLDKWIKDMGKEQEFSEFLDKYAKTDRNIDIERALKENPDNELIKKFAKAAEQSKQDIEANYKAYKESIKKE